MMKKVHKKNQEQPVNSNFLLVFFNIYIKNLEVTLYTR